MTQKAPGFEQYASAAIFALIEPGLRAYCDQRIGPLQRRLSYLEWEKKMSGLSGLWHWEL